jgi:glycosyltransferase involved in cell wall biosynthesis
VARLGGHHPTTSAFRHAHAWVGGTKSICDHLVKSGLPAERVHHIGNLVSIAGQPDQLTRLTLRKLHGIPKDSFVLFTQGRLVESKGVDVLLRALARLPTELDGRTLLLLIAGEGPEEAALRQLAEELGLQERVGWLGAQVPKDFLALSDLMVNPAREDSQGKAILDAWSHGLPVVSTATEAAGELITQEVSGLLAQPGYPASLASHLKVAILAPAATRMALGLAGEAIVRQRFSRKAVVSAYLALYNDLLKERGVI